MCDFPFQQACHRSAWVAAVLTPLARFAFSGPSPLFLFDANAPGSGKGLLCNTTSLIVSGKPFAVTDYAHNDDEMGKRIATIAREGDRMVLLDNVEGKFGNRNLCAALTADRWKARTLGETASIEAPLFATWYATANNCQLSSDMARRVAHIRLECNVENPEERTGFRHGDLRSWVAENRPRLLAAALTILSRYIRTGRPGGQLPPWGDYVGWTATVRGALVWVGLPDPVETKVKLREYSDAETATFAAFLAGWDKLSPDGKGMTVGQIIDRLYPFNGAEIDSVLHPLRDLVDGMVPGERGQKQSKLGYKFRKWVIGGEMY